VEVKRSVKKKKGGADSILGGGGEVELSGGVFCGRDRAADACEAGKKNM